MIYAIAQTEHAISELQVTLKEVKNAKWYRRLKIIQLSMSGISVPQLSEHFDLCQKTVRNYIKTYNHGSIEKLWWYMRQKITRNHFYDSFDQLLKALVGWLKRLPFERFCSLMGIFPPQQPTAIPLRRI